MRTLYHIVAENSPRSNGIRVRQRGIGSYHFSREERTLLLDVAQDIARTHPTHLIFLVPQRSNGLSAKVYFRMPDGRETLNTEYSSEEFWEELLKQNDS